MEKTMVRQAVPLQPMEVDGGADIHAGACGGPHAGAGGCPKEAVTLWEAHTGAGSWQDLWTHGEKSPCWSRFAGRTCDPMGDRSWRNLVLKDCTPWKGPMLEQFAKNCGKDSGWRSLWRTVSCERDPMLEQGKSVMSPPPEEEGAAETTDHNPHSLSPCATGGEEVEKLGVKLSPGRREGWGEGVLRFYFISHYRDLIDNILNKFPQVESVLPMTVIGE
ncbi:EH domain-containing protein 4 [Grus japonensis]|uniref:EH domain-containing protein 4 n=1 Tax=Grus japonensis TaxID=30415 RepID=A0ABC9WLN5_GRUJA